MPSACKPSRRLLPVLRQAQKRQLRQLKQRRTPQRLCLKPRLPRPLPKPHPCALWWPCVVMTARVCNAKPPPPQRLRVVLVLASVAAMPAPHAASPVPQAAMVNVLVVAVGAIAQHVKSVARVWVTPLSVPSAKPWSTLS